MARVSYTSVNHEEEATKKAIASLVIGLVAFTLIYIVCSYENVSARSAFFRNEACHHAFEGRMAYLGTKTPYLPTTNEVLTPEGCTAKMFWTLNRHGTRYPGDDDIIAMLQILPALRDEIVQAATQGKLCKPEVDALIAWRPNTGLNISTESWLVKQGYEELEGIGARYAERFPDLFPAKFSNQTYHFRSTVEQRAVESGKAFAVGALGSAEGVYFPTPVKGDPILHFYKDCDKYNSEVADNPDSLTESNRFFQLAPFQSTLSKVQARLGLERNLTVDEVLLMHKTCAFELAWDPELNLSPWCSVFDEADFKVLEYQEDLEDYWQDGYAYPITYEQACKPVEDVLERFSAGVSQSGTQSTVAYFAHSGTILKVYGRLGLFRDSKNLTSDGYEYFELKREWRTSQIGKFASNLAFVLYHCPKESSPYQVGTFVQEKPTPIPACNDQWVCPFERFKSSLQSIAENCDLDKICKV